ncbi:MAG TPA: hypothetical protein VGB77_03985 [Abditibacteriaceae bacterium]
MSNEAFNVLNHSRLANLSPSLYHADYIKDFAPSDDPHHSYNWWGRRAGLNAP